MLSAIADDKSALENSSSRCRKEVNTMEKKSMVTILVACILTLALLSSTSPISNVWWGLSVIADNDAVGLVGVIEGAKWGFIAGSCGAGPVGGVAVAVGVGL